MQSQLVVTANLEAKQKMELVSYKCEEHHICSSSESWMHARRP